MTTRVQLHLTSSQSGLTLEYFAPECWFFSAVTNFLEPDTALHWPTCCMQSSASQIAGVKGCGQSATLPIRLLLTAWASEKSYHCFNRQFYGPKNFELPAPVYGWAWHPLLFKGRPCATNVIRNIILCTIGITLSIEGAGNNSSQYTLFSRTSEGGSRTLNLKPTCLQPPSGVGPGEPRVQRGAQVCEAEDR